MEKYMTVRELYEAIAVKDESLVDGVKIEIDGWVRGNRFMGNMGFLTFNDGTCFKNAQLVYSKDIEDFDMVEKIKLGAAVNIVGEYRLTPKAKQPFEILLEKVVLIGDVEDSFPLQKKSTSFEFLRTIPHLRPRTNTFKAVFRVRSILAYAIHEFFQGEGFIYVQTPIITSNDAEGAGETFGVAPDFKDQIATSEKMLP